MSLGMIRVQKGHRKVPFCIRESMENILETIDSNWRPRRDLNPCYRRERAVS